MSTNQNTNLYPIGDKMKLRVQSKVIGVFPHNVKHVLDLHPKRSLESAMDATRQFSLCWHPAKVKYMLEAWDFRGRWFVICEFMEGNRVSTREKLWVARRLDVSNCTQAKTEKQALSDGYF